MGDKEGNQIDDKVLRAFIAGKLDAAQESRIAVLVNKSPELIARLAEISNDGLMERLKNSSKPLVKANDANAESPSSLPNQGVRVAKRTGVTDVPTELASYAEYKIIKELGRGGMGVVYLAKNIRMDRLEVLKVLNERLLDHDGAKERFLREIRAVSKLNHANIVTSYSILPLDDLMVFAMEHVHGTDLHKFIHKHTRLPIGLACAFAQQFAAGLQHAHEKGLVHRDVKPSNAIVYKADGQLQLKILDFGLAKATSEKDQSSLTQDGSMLGTPEYMSPEQTLNAAKADIRADIYSLGCTLYFMLTGQPPFSGTHGEVLMAHAQRDARQVTLLRPEVPSELAAVVARMMAKDPQKRYQTPAEVHVALKPFLRSSKQVEKNVRALVAVETNTVNDLGTPSRDTSVEQALPELSLTPDHSISSELSPQQQIATLMADHRTAKGQRRRRKKGRASWFGKHLHIAMPLLGTFFVGLLWLGTLIFRTADGTIIIDNLPVDADVLVDGKRLEIIWNAGEDKAEIRVAPGTRQVEVRSKGIKVAGESVKIVANESVSMTVRIDGPISAPNQTATVRLRNSDEIQELADNRDNVTSRSEIADGTTQKESENSHSVKIQAMRKSAVKWLLEQQKRNGSWSLVGRYSDGGSSENSTAATALALLALTGAEDLCASNELLDIERGIAYLVDRQDATGCFAQSTEPSRQNMYAHAIATFALCNFLANNSNSAAFASAQKGVDYLEWAQSKLGGWRYEPREDSDLSVTGWCVAALTSAKGAGLNVEPAKLNEVHRFLDRVKDKQFPRYSYDEFAPPSLSMTASGLLCRCLLGWTADQAELQAACGDDLLPGKPDANDKQFSVYYWLHATEAIAILGGETWEDWRTSLVDTLYTLRESGGLEEGSWDPSMDAFGASGGRLYTTSLCLKCLNTAQSIGVSKVGDMQSASLLPNAEYFDLEPELLANPSNEETESSDATPGWTVVEGRWKIVNDGAYDAKHGIRFFQPEPGPVASLTQTVPLEAFRSSIDSRRLYARFRGYLRTDTHSNADEASAKVDYLDANGTVLSSFESIKHVHQSTWVEVEDLRIVPKFARFAKITLCARRLGGQALQGFFDALSLKVFEGPRSSSSLSTNQDLALNQTGETIELLRGDLAETWSMTDLHAQHWTLENGVLKFDGNGKYKVNLSTKEHFGDFTLNCEWRIGQNGDSGIYLHGIPQTQVQIWDHVHGKGKGIGSGGLYNNKTFASSPLIVADNPVGEWNTMSSTIVGNKVTVLLNGRTVTEGVRIENYPESQNAENLNGPITIETYGTPIEFKRMTITKFR